LPAKPWTLGTKGIFVKKDKDADPDSEGRIPDIVKQNGWEPTLDAAGIEDIIYNVEDQVDDPTDEQLFQAFIFYIANDAFIDFSEV
jgi:hypothetical protein